MPSETDVIEQLGRYGNWLAHRDTVAGTGSPVEIPVTRVAPARPRLHRAWPWAAAAAAAAIGLVVSQHDGDSSNVVTSPTTAVPSAGEPLYLLPPAGFAGSNGYQSTAVADTVSGVVIGRPVPGGYIDTATVLVSEAEPEQLPLSSGDSAPQRTELPGGGWVIEGSLGAQAALPRGEQWLLARDSPGEGEGLADVLDQIIISEEGRLDVRSDSAFVVISTVHEGGDTFGTYTEVTGPDGARYVIETAGAIDPLATVAAQADWLGPATIRGTSGWQIVRSGPPTESGAIAWNETSAHVVFLSGAPFEQLVELADGLRVVDEATWREATGADGTAG